MAKAVVSQAELLDWLNTEIRKHDACADCRVTSIQKIVGIDADGCNWSTANLRCSGRPVMECEPVLAHVIESARKQFLIA